MSDQAYFDQVEQNINSLLAEKKFKEAYRSCTKFLDLYPGTNQLISLKGRIEEEIEDYNKSHIDSKIKEAKDLYGKGEYAKMLKALTPLLEVAPNNSALRKLIKKGQEKYKEQIEGGNKKFLDQRSEELNKILKENPNQLIPQLLILEQNNRGSKLVNQLSQVFRDKLIEKKIKDKQDLTQSTKYELIHQFLEELDKIQQGNPRVKEIKDELRIKEHSEQTLEKNDFVYSSQKQLNTLIQLKKYDKAIKVAREILAFDPKNTKTLKQLKSITNLHYYQSKEIVIDQMVEASKLIEIEYKKDKKGFVKI